jgi:glycosyltransferase involved in cell wall biosynthesis
MSDDLVIGHAATCYGTRRVSHALPLAVHGIRYRRVHRLPWHRLPFAPEYWVNRYDFFPRPAVDAMHFFNGIGVARMPWISSIEMEFPRYFGAVPQRAFDEAMDRIASDHCKLLLPLSDAARQHFLSRVDPSRRAAVAAKTEVFTGGVSIPADALALRERRLQSQRDEFVIAFVGRLYWHKGGPALVAAVERLRRQGVNARLVLVSAFEAASHISPRDDDEVRRTRAQIAGTPWIELHERLPNDEVLAKMADCDVFAFPTLDESLGWVAIEAAGLGLPVVCSNIFALPEIVEHGVTGLTIDLPLDDDRRWRGIESLNPAPRPSYEEASEQLTRGMVAAFTRLLESPALGTKFGQAGRARFLERYEEHLAARRLATLLRGALA